MISSSGYEKYMKRVIYTPLVIIVIQAILYLPVPIKIKRIGNLKNGDSLLSPFDLGQSQT